MKSFYISVTDFSLSHTLECGQVFRWNKIGHNVYLGVVGHSIVKIGQEKNRLYVVSSNHAITPAFIKSYFDLTLDLPYIYNKIGKDKHIKAALERFRGLRIIRQPLWECLASFVISTQNNIPRIKGIIDKVSRCFGRRLVFEGTANYSFPTAQKFCSSTFCQLKSCGTGYRAQFLKKTARTFLKKRLNEEILKNEPYDKARESLLAFHGVGPKVADCVLLYSAGRLEAFPVDVWIKRIAEKLYFGAKIVSENKIREFAMRYFGEYAGYAQQYLYHYGRTNKYMR